MMYTTHPDQLLDPGGEPTYHMNQVGAWAMTGSVEIFRQGATAFRNGRRFAKKPRNDAIALVNKKADTLVVHKAFPDFPFLLPLTAIC